MGEENKNNTTDNNNNNNNNGYEDICYICRRTESTAGKMIHLPGNICVCPACMQKTFDSMQNMNGNLPNYMDMMNMGFPPGMNFNPANNQDVSNRHKIKKKKEKPKDKEGCDNDSQESPSGITRETLPAPHIIKASLDEYVVGQEQAKKVISVGVYNHYKRVLHAEDARTEIEKSNMLMLGPTGCGKTYLVKTLAKILQVPLAITDATTLTEAGYIGDDVESVLSKLLSAADNDVEKAEMGIIYIDEIDKIAKKRNTNSRDVSGESVQQGLLKLLEGADVEVPVGATSKNAMVPMTTINTKNILFICGGAFPDLEKIIAKRLNKQASIGFTAHIQDKYEDDPSTLAEATTEDLREFGMIPEFIGRLPVLFSLEPMSKELLIRILSEPKNAILKQYKELLAYDEVDLTFDEDAKDIIAEMALEKKTGARALRAIIEEFMLDIMYEIPKDSMIGHVTITGDYIRHKGGPLIEMRTAGELPA